MNDDERLQDILREDTGSDALLPLVQQIQQLPRPHTTLSSDALLQRIQPQPRWYEWYPLLLLRSQLPVVANGIFLASAMVFALGAFVTLSIDEQQPQQLPVVIIAPVVAATGIALLYEDEQSYELEDASQHGMALLMLTRVLLVFSFDLAMGLLLSAGISWLTPEISLLILIEAWLFPMTFIAALSFWVTVASGNSFFAIALSMGIWVSHLGWSAQPSGWLKQWLVFEGLSNGSIQLIGVSVLMLLSAFWILQYTELRKGVIQ